MGVNVQVLATSVAAVAVLAQVRTTSAKGFACTVALPALLYGLLAERTRRMRLRGKCVVVTGASSGLGAALAVEAARRGAGKVVVVARRRDALERTAARCRAANPDVETFVVVCDVARAPQALVDDLERQAVPCDLLVNNAGSGAWKFVEETSAAEVVGMMGCPYVAAFSLTALVVPGMAARGSGHVLNVTSGVAEVGLRGCCGYGVARWAMRAFSRLLKADVRELGIGVTCLVAAEITDTDYFTDAPGKPGTASKAKIPRLFQAIGALGLNYGAERTARAALCAVEHGWATIYTPSYLLLPFKMLGDVLPCVVDGLVAFGTAGLRAPCP